MKRIALVIAIALLVTGCAGLLAEEPIAEIRPHHYGEFDYIAYGSGSRLFYETTLEGIERRATNIVIGRMKDDATMVLQFSEQTGTLAIGHNFVSFEITEVIKGDLMVGELIRIGEPYHIYDGFLYAWADYMPSVPNQEYVFILGAQATTAYVPEHIGAFPTVHSERSRFPVPGGFCREAIRRYLGEDGRFSADLQDFTSPVFGLGSRANVVTYSSIWEEVMNKYILPSLLDEDG